MPCRFASCAPESDAAEPFRFADAWRAYIACRRGKRRSASAQRYATGVFDRLTDTVDALASGMWKPAAAQAFVVTRPKAREVLAAAFGDRVVHHLLVPHLERQFEPVFIHDAWSNRVGKGIHAAVARLRGFMQALTDNGARPGFALQLDLANFFNRIDRRILFDLLRRRLERDALRPIDDPRRLNQALAERLLWLCLRLLTGNAAAGARLLGDPERFTHLPPHKRLINAPAGKGVPIGNLTSQFFANVYLNELDRFVKHELRCRHYLRHVDDFVLLAPERATLEGWREAVRDFLRRRLELDLRDEGRIVPVSEGIDFLGYRVRGSHLICRPRVVGHCREALEHWQRCWRRESSKAIRLDLSPLARESLASSVASYAAHFRHARHGRLWARLRDRHAVLPALFDEPREGVCRPTWVPPGDMSLPGQWRYFHAQCSRWFPLPEGWRDETFRPWLLLMQVGRTAEAYGDDAGRIARVWPGHGGRPVRRRGLAQGLAWPLRRLPALFGLAAHLGWHVAWVDEQGYRRGGGKRRVLRRLVIAKPRQQTELGFGGQVGGASAPIQTLQRAKRVIAAEAAPTPRGKSLWDKTTQRIHIQRERKAIMTLAERLGVGLFAATLAIASGVAGANCSIVAGYPETTPDSDFADAGNGTVRHIPSGLIWKRCAEGQTWDGSTCTGSAAGYTWQQAFERADAVNAGTAGTQNAGQTDWRVPNQKELRSIAERGCLNPSINTTQFPAAPASYFWSGSPFAVNSDEVWVVNFNYGAGHWGIRNLALQVRLVRAGQYFYNFDAAGDVTAPVLTGVGVSGTTQTATTLAATSDEAATGYWVVVARDAAAPTADEVKAGANYGAVTVVAAGSGAMAANVAADFAVSGLAAGTDYDLYLVAQAGSVNANFSGLEKVQFSTLLNTHAITATASPSEGGMASCAPNPVAHGGSSTCTYTVNPGYAFANWSGDCSGPACVLSGVDSARSVTANFVPATASYGPIATRAAGVTATLAVTGCGAVDSAAFVDAVGAPAGMAFPYGLLDFTLIGCAGGSTAMVTVTYSSPLPAGTFYKEVGGVYSAYGATQDTHSVSFALTDNGAGDDDATPGVIRDPSGIGVAAANGDPQAIPVLAPLGLALLAGAMGLSGVWLRRRRV